MNLNSDLELTYLMIEIFDKIINNYKIIQLDFHKLKDI